MPFPDTMTRGPRCSRSCSHPPSRSRRTATCRAASTTPPRPGSRPSRSRRSSPRYADNDDPDFRTRAILIKEQRSELVKHHLWVLWTDYFKPPHFEKYPQLHTLFNEATKLAGAAGTKGRARRRQGRRAARQDRRDRRDLLGDQEGLSEVQAVLPRAEPRRPSSKKGLGEAPAGTRLASGLHHRAQVASARGLVHDVPRKSTNNGPRENIHATTGIARITGFHSSTMPGTANGRESDQHHRVDDRPSDPSHGFLRTPANLRPAKELRAAEADPIATSRRLSRCFAVRVTLPRPWHEPGPSRPAALCTGTTGRRRSGTPMTQLWPQSNGPLCALVTRCLAEMGRGRRSDTRDESERADKDPRTSHRP